MEFDGVGVIVVTDGDVWLLATCSNQLEFDQVAGSNFSSSLFMKKDDIQYKNILVFLLKNGKKFFVIYFFKNLKKKYIYSKFI